MRSDDALALLRAAIDQLVAWPPLLPGLDPDEERVRRLRDWEREQRDKVARAVADTKSARRAADLELEALLLELRDVEHERDRLADKVESLRSANMAARCR